MTGNMRGIATVAAVALALVACVHAEEVPPADASTIHGSIMCGYQGWFRCPGDGSNLGWIHWSRDSRKIIPGTLTFELWPDMSEYGPSERFAAPGFTYPDGSQAFLYSADNADTVLRHFQWMRDYGIDGAWLQHFLVDFPGARSEKRYPSRLSVMRHVADAAAKTGRTWALSYDVSGAPGDRVYDLITTNWKQLVDDGTIAHPRYLHEAGRPVVQIWGFYVNSPGIEMTPELADRLIDFFAAPGKYSAFVVGGGDWHWRTNPNAAWQAFYRRFDAYTPWNTGNFSLDSKGIKHATTNYWAEDKKELEAHGKIWIPVVYPGFGWNNLKQHPPADSTIARRGGQFLWEQFYALSKLKPDSIFIAMFDEVDEGTAIYKVTSSPPTQACFQTYEGLPSDWYLRVVREGWRMLKGERAVTQELPIGANP